MKFFRKIFTRRIYHGVTRSYAEVFAAIFVFVFLVTGCLKEPEPDPVDPGLSLNGNWHSEYDAYIVNLINNTFEYDDGGWDFGFTGNIHEIVKFNNAGSAGIVFIEYTIKPIDWDTGIPPEGDFIGIYFRNLTTTTVEFAVPAENVSGDYITPAKTSLANAKAAFTEGTTGDYISYWGVYVKQ